MNNPNEGRNQFSGHGPTNNILRELNTSKLSQRVKEISHKSHEAIL